MTTFQGKKAIVTGANRSMGRHIAIALAKQGADIVISYRSDEAGAMATLESIKQYSPASTALYADFSNLNEVHQFAEKAIKHLGHVDLLVNNAAMSSRNTTLDITAEQFATVLQVNTIAPFCLLQACANNMVENKIKGRIVNISSIAASTTFARGVAYASSKAAVNKFTQNTALDYAKYGININSIAPGVIASGMNENTAKTNPELWATYHEKIPLQRVGQPEDICHMTLFLLSDHANWITGKVFEVDGGHIL